MESKNDRPDSERGSPEAQACGGPCLSIISITYNNRSGLEKTADSVACQTWRDFEWIVVDGKSEDGTVEFLQKFRCVPDILISERDDGVYDAMNKGVNLAKGEYCICMNAGDTFREIDTIAKAFSYGFSADVVYGDWVRKSPSGEEAICHSPPELPPLFFFSGRNICQQAMFVRTRLLQQSNFDVNYKIYGDWAKWQKLMLEGCSFQHIPLIVCDFEAETGLSEVDSPMRRSELRRLQAECPKGIAIQAERALAQETELAAARADITSLNAAALRLEAEVSAARADITSLNAAALRLEAEVSAARTEMLAWKRRYEDIANSTCWRMTKPARFVLDRIKTAAGR